MSLSPTCIYIVPVSSSSASSRGLIDMLKYVVTWLVPATPVSCIGSSGRCRVRLPGMLQCPSCVWKCPVYSARFLFVPVLYQFFRGRRARCRCRLRLCLLGLHGVCVVLCPRGPRESARTPQGRRLDVPLTDLRPTPGGATATIARWRRRLKVGDLHRRAVEEPVRNQSRVFCIKESDGLIRPAFAEPLPMDLTSVS
jgi:hypothetical protein